MSKEIFSLRIKQLRLSNNFTMEEMAQALGATKSRINMWENGSAIPRDDTLILISKRFGVSIDYLLGNDAQENKKPENPSLHYLQRNLEKLDKNELKKAEDVLKAVFNDIFDDEEEDHGGL